MTEVEWLASEDPAAMLRWMITETHEVSRAPKYSDRKLRLFACACCRRVWDRITDERARAAVEVAERHAEGEATDADRSEARRRAWDVSGWMNALGKRILTRSAAEAASGMLLRTLQIGTPEDAVRHRVAQAALLREIVGSPFRPVTLPPGLCPWLTPAVLSLARAAYDERSCRWEGRMHDHDEPSGWVEDGTLDSARLLVLSDALEEAGCDSKELLRHLRGHERAWFYHGPDDVWDGLRGPHVRGCWALDLILGKE